MNSRGQILVCGALLIGGGQLFSLPDPSQVMEAMRRANGYYQASNPQGAADWLYGAYHTGNLKAGIVLAEMGYIDYSREWGTLNTWKVGSPWPISSSSNTHRLHADSHVAGQTYIDLSLLDADPGYRAEIKQAMDDLLADVSWSDWRSVDNYADDDWWWVDAFYMAAPVLARMANIEGDEAYRHQLRAMYDYMKVSRGLFDAAEGLWYRDENAKSEISPDGSKVFWSRGNGWVMAGLARVLEQLPEGHPDRAEFSGMLQTMAASLISLQGGDGFWRSNLLDPDHYSNPETSGTAFFTVALTYGVREGLLDEATYLPVIEAAWTGLTTLALQADGFLGYVQDVGRAPAGASVTSTRNYGVGAFLLAGSEILLLQDAAVPLLPNAGPDQTLLLADAVHELIVQLDGSQSVVFSGDIQKVSWWTGDIFLGEGMSLEYTLPAGSWPILMRIEHDSGQIFEDIVEVTLLPLGEVVFPDLVQASTYQDPNTPANVLDNNLGTRWSAEGEGQWIAFQFAEPELLTAVEAALYQGDIRQAFFDVEVSDNGVSWIPVLENVTTSGNTLGLERFSFPPVSARYLRIVGFGNSLNLWNSFTEVRLRAAAPGSDLDEDGLPDIWEIARSGSTSLSPDGDEDADGRTNLDEFIFGTHPLEYSDPSPLKMGRTGQALQVSLDTIAALGPGYGGLRRQYTIETSSTLDIGGWQPDPARGSFAGTNLPVVFDLAEPVSGSTFHRLKVELVPSGLTSPLTGGQTPGIP